MESTQWTVGIIGGLDKGREQKTGGSMQMGGMWNTPRRSEVHCGSGSTLEKMGPGGWDDRSGATRRRSRCLRLTRQYGGAHFTAVSGAVVWAAKGSAGLCLSIAQ